MKPRHLYMVLCNTASDGMIQCNCSAAAVCAVLPQRPSGPPEPWLRGPAVWGAKGRACCRACLVLREQFDTEMVTRPPAGRKR